jgi:hypothetical protein
MKKEFFKKIWVVEEVGVFSADLNFADFIMWTERKVRLQKTITIQSVVEVKKDFQKKHIAKEATIRIVKKGCRFL